jgi:hypothetical protein
LQKLGAQVLLQRTSRAETRALVTLLTRIAAGFGRWVEKRLDHQSAVTACREKEQKKKLAVLSDQIAEARRIIDAQQALLEELRIAGAPTHKAEDALRTYASSLMHLLAHERKLIEEAEAKRGQTKPKSGHAKA